MKPSRYALPFVLLLNGCSCAGAPLDDGGLPSDGSTLEHFASESGGESEADHDVDAGDLCTSAAINQARTGCDYVAFSPSRMGFFPYACLALVVLNPNADDVALSLRWQGTDIDLTKHASLTKNFGRSMLFEPMVQPVLPAHRTMVVSLVEGALNQVATGCPAPAIITSETAHIDALPNALARTFRLKTSAPTVVYQVWPFTKNSIDYTTVGQLPAVPSWQASYIDVGAYLPPPYEYSHLAWTAALANVDGTIVAMPSADAGAITATLASDELVNVARGDLFVGQRVSASNPFALWSGSAGFQVPGTPETSTSCFASLAIPPPQRWGRDYVFARPSDRIDGVTERHFFRILAATSGTALTYSPAAPQGAPSTLGKGESATFFFDQAFVVRSQDIGHPIFVSSYGVDPMDFEPAIETKHGGCSTSFVPAVEQYGSAYDFFSLPNYPNSQLVVVRRRDAASDVELDCAGKIGGWEAIDAEFEAARVWLSRDSNDVFNPEVYPTGTCDNGPHSIRSASPFGLTVYGWLNTPFGAFNGLAKGSDPNAQAASSYQFVPLALAEPKRP